MITTIAPIPYPKELQPIVETIPKSYLVGGCVRDHLLGLKPKDLDVEVYGMSYENLEKKLRNYGKVDLVGKSFGVIKLTLPSGEIYDFSLARKDSKIPDGEGHKAFKVDVDTAITEKEGAARRDLTINSLMYDPRNHTIVDYYGGMEDLKKRTLRHTSPLFAEDPLRVLRVMQFSARFDFDVAPETIDLCKGIKSGFNTLAKERVGEEFFKMLTKGKNIKRGLEFLKDSEWLEHFPELKKLDGCQQGVEDWHPEGDAFVHTGFCCNAMAELPRFRAMPERERLVYMLGILCHDLGKPACTRLEFKPKLNRKAWVSPGHDIAGEAPTRSLLARFKTPHEVTRRVVPLVVQHMAHLQLKTDEQIRNLAVKMTPDNIYGLGLVTESDHSGRPPLPKEQPEAMVHILNRAAALDCLMNRPHPIVLGRHIEEWSALPPGKAYGVLCSAAYEAQLRGTIKDEASAKEWFRYNRGKILENAKMAPDRLISGGDLVTAGVPTGPILGKLQRELFELQIDGVHKTREDSLAFLVKNKVVYNLDDKVLKNLEGLTIEQTLARATKTVKIAGQEITAPDPIAKNVLDMKSGLSELDTYLQKENIKLTGKVLGSGLGSIVVETMGKRALRIGIGKVQKRPDIPEMLPGKALQFGGLRVEETMILQESKDPEDLKYLREKIKTRGYVDKDLELDNIGRDKLGRLYIIDPGAISKQVDFDR